MSKEEFPIDAIISDLRSSHAATTQGEWMKGETTHETVCKRDAGKPYRVASFRHADDAQFCDVAHAFVPRLLDELEKARAALEAKQAEPDTSGIVSDCDLDKAFSGTHFGTEDHRSLLHQAVLKKSLNYHCGHTITEIMRELGLTRKSGEPTSKGIDMLRVAYRDLTTNGP